LGNTSPDSHHQGKSVFCEQAIKVISVAFAMCPPLARRFLKKTKSKFVISTIGHTSFAQPEFLWEDPAKQGSVQLFPPPSEVLEYSEQWARTEGEPWV